MANGFDRLHIAMQPVFMCTCRRARIIPILGLCVSRRLDCCVPA